MAFLSRFKAGSSPFTIFVYGIELFLSSETRSLGFAQGPPVICGELRSFLPQDKGSMAPMCDNTLKYEALLPYPLLRSGIYASSSA